MRWALASSPSITVRSARRCFQNAEVISASVVIGYSFGYFVENVTDVPIQQLDRRTPLRIIGFRCQPDQDSGSRKDLGLVFGWQPTIWSKAIDEFGQSDVQTQKKLCARKTGFMT